MPQHLPPKNKVCLADYNFRQDLEMRLFLSELTEFQWLLLKEIVDGSLKQSISELADLLEVSEEEVEEGVNFFKDMKLFKLEGKKLLIDKEPRRAFERQLIKFDATFQPNLIYLQTLLNQVPIHVVPNWYDISKTTDHIFSSIIEKFWSTPKAYENYIKPLQFDEPLLHKIIDLVFHSPEYKVEGKQLLSLLKIEREVLEEHLMLLEYSMVLCLSYELKEGIWEEVVTPFYEWREYLLELRRNTPEEYKGTESPKKIISGEDLVNSLYDELVLLSKGENQSILSEKLIEMEWVEEDGSKRSLSSEGKKLLEKEEEEAKRGMKALLLRYPSSFLGFSDKDIRELERSLRPLLKKGWIPLSSWIESLSCGLGDKKGYHLETKGKKWRFQRDPLTEKELKFIQKALKEHFLAAGLIDTAEIEGKAHLRVTPFGKKMIG